MGKNDKKIFEQQNFCGYTPSPVDERDFDAGKLYAAVPLPEEYIVEKKMNILNQGSIGSCVAHSIATACGYGELKGGKNIPHDFSRGFIYANRKETDAQGEGMNIRQALKQLNHCGDCEYKIFPWNETYPKVKARLEEKKDYYLSNAEPFKIINYFRCYTEEQIKLALINQGAVVLGMPVYNSFEEKVPLPTADDELRGGHAMCLIGWNKDGWIIQNSWSSAWGDKGCCYVPYDYPVNEWWGITVNLDVPEPEKENTLVKILNAIGFVLGWIYKKIKKIFR